MLKGLTLRWNLHDSPFTLFWLLWEKLSRKTSLLVKAEIFELFANILTANDMDFLHKRESILQPVQMQVSKKPKIFSQLFPENLKST